jgi:hypothetical protein
MSRYDYSSTLAGMLKHIVIAAMPFDPTLSLQSRHDFRSVGFWLSHSILYAQILAYSSELGI